MSGRGRVACATVFILATGCYEGLGPESDVITTRDENFNSISINGISINGLSINGLSINGLSINGLSINGISINGLSINGISINGISINGLSINGSEFTATFMDGNQLVHRGGVDFVGAEWDFTATQVDGDGNEISEDFVLHVDDVYLDPQWDDVYLYEISYRPKLGNNWAPLCKDGNGNALPAIPVVNRWDPVTGARVDDPTVFTFGCTNAVLAKCVGWGYRPWVTATECKDWDKKKQKAKDCHTVSLQDYHQACTRMARADYCGDGQPWTVNGTPIDIYDHLTPQIEAKSTDWPVEAEWTPDGAGCLNQVRHPEFGYPKCFLDKKGKPKKFKDCGSLKEHRAQLANAFDKYGEGL